MSLPIRGVADAPPATSAHRAGLTREVTTPVFTKASATPAPPLVFTRRRQLQGVAPVMAPTAGAQGSL